MKRCLVCDRSFEAIDFLCPNCGHSVDVKDGFRMFAPELAFAGSGFEPAYFDDLIEAEGRNFWFRKRNDLIRWSIRRYIPNFSSFLEVGCGTGFVISALVDEFPNRRFVGSEIFLAGLRMASGRLPEVELIQMDACRIPFSSEFDVVGVFDVVEHIDDDRCVLSQIARSLKPEGYVLITVPQHPWLWSNSDVYARHVRRYTKQELHDKLTDAGLQVVRSTSFVSFLLPLLAVSRWIEKKKDVGSYDPSREFVIPRWINFLLETVLAIEVLCIRIGIDFCAGGTRLVVAQRSSIAKEAVRRRH